PDALANAVTSAKNSFRSGSDLPTGLCLKSICRLSATLLYIRQVNIRQSFEQHFDITRLWPLVSARDHCSSEGAMTKFPVRYSWVGPPLIPPKAHGPTGICHGRAHGPEECYCFAR